MRGLLLHKYGHWLSDESFDENEFFGFTYLVVNKTNNRKYIGKKQFFQYRNRKKWKRFDWGNYTSSSKELNLDIETLGKENFDFRILQLCLTRGELTYREANEQHKRDVLVAKLPCGQREYYNKSIAGIKFLPILSHTDGSKSKISRFSSQMKKNTDGLLKDAESKDGKSRRSKVMRDLNLSGKMHKSTPRQHILTFKNGETLLCDNWIVWAKENGYSVSTLENLRKGRGKTARQNRVSSDKDVVRIQPKTNT
jgi:hypothetical protein